MEPKMGRRELLLSLKSATIEACFSVPMLNLTMPSFPFVIAFAVAALGWGPGAVGLMAALPHVCNLIQPILATALRRRMSLLRIMAIGFLVNAAPWGLISLLPFLQPSRRGVVFAAVLIVATLANSITAVAWSAAIAQLVPPRLSGTYFGRRNLIFGFWTLVVVLTAGAVAEKGGNSLATFGWIFAVAGLGRLAGYYFLRRMTFPAAISRQEPVPPDWREITEPLRDTNYLKLVAFVGCWGFLLNLGQPFYTVFLLEGLHRSMGEVGLLTALAGAGGLLTLRGWGFLCDRFGSKPVLYVASIVWALSGLVFWSLAGERFFWHLALAYPVVGATTAGFQLCQFNLMLKLAPANKAPYVAAFLALTSLMTALGPILGGLLLRVLPDRLGVFLGQTIWDYHLIIAISMVGCLLCVHLLDFVMEEEAHPTEAVWRTMRRMSPFNPMLTLTSTAQMVLTPGGLIDLTRHSWRQIRRQARRLGDVGEELAEGSREVLASPFAREGSVANKKGGHPR